MKFLINRYCHRHQFLMVVLSVVVLCAVCPEGYAQEPPPRPLEVTVAQNLGFGAFTHGAAGGTITINAAGSRSASPGIILLNLGYSFSAAIYQLVANPGTVISFLPVSDVTLTGSAGGSMNVHIGASVPAIPFVLNTVPPVYTPMNIGGTLTVGSSGSNPPGNYSGSFDITFIQE